MSRASDDQPAVAVNAEIGPDTPLRLKDAIRLAYPCGGMTVHGLRLEAKRKRLMIETTAGKQFTTLRNIEEMRKLCRAEAKDHTSGSEQNGQTDDHRPGSSETALTDAERKAARDSALMRLSTSEAPPSPGTSPRNTTHGPKADVIPIKR
jgi:hypothetical protein